METTNAAAQPAETSIGISAREMSQSGREGEAERPEFMVRVGKAVYQLPAIQQWDLNGDGVITEEELAAAAVSHGKLQSSVVNYKRMLPCLLLLLALSVAAMIASVIIGVRITREIKTDGRRLLTTGGDILQVTQAYDSPTLLSLFNTTWTQLHNIQDVAFYVPALNAVRSFRVEEVQRNATMLLLTSSAASTLYISESAATLVDSQGLRFAVEGAASPAPPGGDARRRLLDDSEASADSSASLTVAVVLPAGRKTSKLKNVAPPCCP